MVTPTWCGLEQWLSQRRRNVKAPVKHHYVPQFLLRNFADAKEQLVVHRLDQSGSFPAVVLKTGHRNDGHTLYGPSFDGGKDRTTLESMMSGLEAKAALVISELASPAGASELSEEHRHVLRWFAGLQTARSRFTFGYISRQAEQEGGPIGLTREETQTGLLMASTRSHLDAWMASKDPDSHYKDRYSPFGSELMAFRWDLVRFKQPSLVVSDAFAAQSGIRVEQRHKYHPVQKNWAKHGIGVPLNESARVTMALTPTLGVYLHRGTTKKALKAEAFIGTASTQPENSLHTLQDGSLPNPCSVNLWRATWTCNGC